MFTIKSKKENVLVWDSINNKPLIKFSDFTAKTNNKDIALKLQKMGYEVLGKIEADVEDEPKTKSRKGRPPTNKND